MSAGLPTAAAFCAALGGFTSLSLAMDRHFEDSFGRGKSPGKWLPWLRLGGVLGLLAALLACLRAGGTSQGWVLYFGVLTAAAMCLVLVLTYAPRRLRLLAVIGLAAPALALVFGKS